MLGDDKNETPMMQQYWKFRKEAPPDALLLFRMGDFYELFHQDAEEGARLLGITLTRRQNYPMAGIPFHAADAYIPKLLTAGRKVAVVDQIETPVPGKLVRRELTRILTPGTTLDEAQVDARSNQYLLALHLSRQGLCAAWIDVTAGEITIAQAQTPQDLVPVLMSLRPRELLLPENWDRNAEDARLAPHFSTVSRWCSDFPVTRIPEFHFEMDSAVRTVLSALKVLNLEGFGVSTRHPALCCAGALIDYTTQTLCGTPQNVSTLREYRSEQSVLLDPATLRNLEVFQGSARNRDGSLLEAIDQTVTAAGARLLEQWLAEPLRELPPLRERQQTVNAFLSSTETARKVREHLKGCRDLIRILGRLQNRLRNPRELGGVRETLEKIPLLRECLLQSEQQPLNALGESLKDFSELRQHLDAALQETLPGDMSEGGVIKEGFDAELDRLRNLAGNHKNWVSNLEREQQEATGIKNLKVRYNGAFGYYIEITKSNLHLVPNHYIRRQTMVNAERFVTEELRQKEKEILHADENALAREQELFQELIARILSEAQALKETACLLSRMDVLAGWAVLARDWDYCCPELDETDALEIQEGRHPVIEQKLKADSRGFGGSKRFVPNDTFLASSTEQIALITGPNMAGKSTYIRQVALISLMAHIGCFVPARQCRMGMIDRIFSRIGASDELSRGNSTFMVEMNETANILNNATHRSLIILDEIGRGTSTWDGLSIAWAVLEHLHSDATQGPKTLFATHYHEITKLENALPRLRNYCVAVKEWNDEIVFVRQVLPGSADRSYGIQVARLAGMPQSVVNRAQKILRQLEQAGAVATERVEDPPAEKPRKKSRTRSASVIAEPEEPFEHKSASKPQPFMIDAQMKLF